MPYTGSLAHWMNGSGVNPDLDGDANDELSQVREGTGRGELIIKVEQLSDPSLVDFPQSTHLHSAT